MSETIIQRVVAGVIVAIIQGIVWKWIIPNIKFDPTIRSIRQISIVVGLSFVITFGIIMLIVKPVKPVKWELEGRVLDATTGSDLSGAEIAIQEGYDRTGSDGRFLVRGESFRKLSEVRVRVELEDYKPVIKFVRIDDMADIELEPK